jgi:mannose/fructose/N-acetylgalactosamine-specific phosphotransferase system component IIC
MVSRPVVAATLAGLLLGAPVPGFLAGAVLEFFFLPVFAIGGGRFPESGPGAVVAGAAAAWIPSPAGIAVGLMLGLVLGEFGGVTINALRRINGRIAPDPSKVPVTKSRVARAHLSSIAIDFARAAALTLVGLTLARVVGASMGRLWPLDIAASAGLMLAGVSIPLGMLLRNLGGWQRHRWTFILGLGGGIAIGLLV